ncbi:MAG: hypothetical protein ACRDF4_09085 [Rhabdochlamydiaceae bacterium]
MAQTSAKPESVKVPSLDYDKVDERINELKKQGIREIATALGQPELFYTISGQVRFMERTFQRLARKYDHEMMTVKDLRENLDKILDKNLTLPDSITQEVCKAINEINVDLIDKVGNRVRDYVKAMGKEDD